MSGMDRRPPAPGISRSSRMVSTRTCASASMASSAVPATAAISKLPSPSSIRVSTARATIESSTIIRRMRGRSPRPNPGPDLASAGIKGAASGDADELELDVQSLAVERLHHILIRAGFQGRADMRHVILGCAEDDLGLVVVAALAKQLEEFHTAHHRHVPVEQDDVGHAGLAARQRLAAVAGLVDLEFERFQDMAGDLSDHLAVVNYQAGFHGSFSVRSMPV